MGFMKKFAFLPRIRHKQTNSKLLIWGLLAAQFGQIAGLTGNLLPAQAQQTLPFCQSSPQLVAKKNTLRQLALRGDRKQTYSSPPPLTFIN
jgi:hypothetical protein